MDTSVLKYFKVAAEFGNMSRAAEELHISQPTLTVAIKKLEQELKIILFDRSKKGIALTPQGAQIFNKIDEFLRDWDSIKQEAEGLTQEIRGVIRLGVHPSVACYFLPMFMPRLLKQNPLLEIRLHHDLSRNILQNILDHQVDVGLVINPQKSPDLVVTELLQDEVNIWKRKSGSIDDTLIYDPSLHQTQWLLKNSYKIASQFKRKIESNNLEVITSLLRSGCGHAILPKRVAHSMPVDIECSFPKLKPFKDSLYMVYRPVFRKTNLGKVFIDGVSTARDEIHLSKSKNF